MGNSGTHHEAVFRGPGFLASCVSFASIQSYMIILYIMSVFQLYLVGVRALGRCLSVPFCLEPELVYIILILLFHPHILYFGNT